MGRLSYRIRTHRSDQPYHSINEIKMNTLESHIPRNHIWDITDLYDFIQNSLSKSPDRQLHYWSKGIQPQNIEIIEAMTVYSQLAILVSTFQHELEFIYERSQHLDS
jgi:hypothetical protein